MSRQVQLENSWKKHLLHSFSEPYMLKLKAFLSSEFKQKKKIFPPGEKYFEAFNCTPFKKVKVVLLGQDPYHGLGQAHGLSFSVPKGVSPPPSLRNIYQELKQDLNIPICSHGHLKAWAEQGVLLLNSTLTVLEGRAASHRGKGWEEFTDKVIEILNEKKEALVFLLWGSSAQKKGAIVDSKKHCVLKAPHPSPLSAHLGFLGCGHFSKTNAYLKTKGKEPIDWSSHLK